MRDDVVVQLEKIPGLAFTPDVDLKKYSTMQLQARGDLILISSVSALIDFKELALKESIEFIHLGWGANQILPKKSSRPYLKLKFEFDKSYLDESKEFYQIPASVSLSSLSAHAVRFGLTGWEVFTGIPATLGGAIAMNAGTGLGEICEVLEEVEIIRKNGHRYIHKVEEDSFSYRKNNFLNEGDTVVSAKLFHKGIDPEISLKIKEYLNLRNKSQPLKEKTCGCIFKNAHNAGPRPCRAGLFLDILGMKGFTLDQIQVSPIHANFMVNLGGGDSQNVKEIISAVLEEARYHSGVNFETEAIFADED